MKEEQIKEFLEKVRSGNEPFMMDRGGRFTMYTQAPVNEHAKVIFSDYRFNHCHAADIVDMKLEPVAIVSNDAVYLYNDYHFRSCDLPDDYKWEEHFEDVFEFYEALKHTRDILLNNLIPELYKALPDVELEEHRMVSAKEDARRRLLNRTLTKEQPLADMPSLLDKNAFIRVLCGELNLEEHVTAKYFAQEESRARNKAYRKEVQKHIDSPICSSWEMELADALHDSGAKNVTMEFCYKGNRAIGKINVEQFLRDMGNDNDIDSWCFSTSVEGKKILKELGTGREKEDCLYPCHVESVTYGKKTIYEAGDEAKSLRGDTLDREDDDYER